MLINPLQVLPAHTLFCNRCEGREWSWQAENSSHGPEYTPLGDFSGFGMEDIDASPVCSYPQLFFSFGEAQYDVVAE